MRDSFEREAMLLGEESLDRLEASSVLLFGVGGVGSYIAEALARCGVGSIDIVDNDTVSVSNINRQLCALTSTVGKYKVDVMYERMLDINPELSVGRFYDFVLPENIDLYNFSKYDYVIDAIDTVSAKLAIAEKAYREGVAVISCMGTGNKLDPTAFCVTDISKTSTCPLARVMRRELKARGIPHLKVVYSTEEAKKPTEVLDADSKKHIPGSVAFVPSVAGLIAAGEVIKELVRNTEDNDG